MMIMGMGIMDMGIMAMGTNPTVMPAQVGIHAFNRHDDAIRGWRACAHHDDETAGSNHP